MAEPAVFGRRQAPPARKLPNAKPKGLRPRAQAFSAQLASSPPAGADFAAWNRAQGGRRLVAWLLGFALVLPGLVCFALDAPTSVSILVEAVGLAVAWRLRRERRKRLKEIAGWDPAAASDSAV